MEATTKELLTRINTQLNELKGVKPAVEQLEQQVKMMPATMDQKIRAIRSASWDDRGRYRGIFSTEDDARAFGLYVMAQVGGQQDARDALAGEMKSVIERAMGGDTSLSPTVPIEYAARMQRLVEEFGVWVRNAFPQPMTSDSLTFQRRTSGFTVYKTGRNVAATASDLGFTTINLNADEWNVLTLYPKSLEADAAASIGELVALEIAQAFANQLDLCGFIGDGTPGSLDVHGITSRFVTINGVDDGGGLVLGTGSTGAGWGSLVDTDFLKMMARVPMYRGAMNKFYASAQFFFNVMAKIQIDAGGNTIMSLAEGPKFQFFGAQVEIAQVMPQTAGNSQVACLYGDLRLSSTHGQRQALTIEESRDVKFLERQVAVLGTQRHAVANHSLGDETNAGPVVGLITPAAG